MYELIKDEIYVSKNVADYAVGSGQLFFIASLVALYMKHYYFSGLLFCVYVSTVLFWTQISSSNNVIVYTFDCVLSFLVFIFFITYAADNYFKPSLKPFIYGVFFTCMAVFLINELVYYTLVTSKGDITDIEQKRTINYASVFCHIVFLHILPMSTYFYCIAESI